MANQDFESPQDAEAPESIRANHLLRLAAQLDHAGTSLRNRAEDSLVESASLELTEAEQEELQRIQGALEFIHGIGFAAEDEPILQGNRLHDTEDLTNASSQLRSQGSRATPPAGALDTKTEKAQPQKVRPPGQVPKFVGRFEILSLLGQGGFAKVYLAHDPVLNRSVALKLLRSSLFYSEDVTHRFEREAKASAVLSHPNIVPVFEAGSVQGERYIASAFCEGKTLEQWISSNAPIDPSLAAESIATLADALAHAHQRGIIHRDLKPANILVETAADLSDAATQRMIPEKLRVTDFGLAKHLGSTDQKETAEGAIVGTPAYMSPEQASGNSKVESTSDIYSLGVILFEMLTGKLPILGNSNIDTLLRIKTDRIPSPRSINEAIPKDLDAICLKCLNKDPDRRYQSAHELAADLRRWSNGEPVLARHASLLERTSKWVRRNPMLSAAFAGVTLAMLGAFSMWRVAVAEYQRAERNLVVAEDQAQRVQRHLDLSQKVIDQMVTKVGLDRRLPPKLRKSVAEKASGFQEELLVDVVPGSSQEVETVIQTVLAHNRLARILFDLSELDAALEQAERSLELCAAHLEVPRLASLHASASQIKANTLTVLNRDQESRKAIDSSEKITSHNSIALSSNRFSVAMSLLNESKYEEAIDQFEEGYELIRDNPHGHLLMNKGRLLLYWGRAEMSLKRFKSAKEHTLQALDKFQQLLTSHGNVLAIPEDKARCQIQLTELELAQINDKSSAEQISMYANAAAEPVAEAKEAFGELIVKDSGIPRFWGQKAFCYQLEAKVRIHLEDLPAVESTMDEFFAFVESIPGSNVLHANIFLAYLESRLEVATMYRERDNSADSLRHAELAYRQCQQYADQFPDRPQTQSTLKECSSFLEKMKQETSGGSQDTEATQQAAGSEAVDGD